VNSFLKTLPDSPSMSEDEVTNGPTLRRRPHRQSLGARAVAHGAEWYRGGDAPRRALLFLDELDLSPDDNGGLMQSERPLEMVCRKHHQLLDHSRLSTRLGESDAPFGYLSVVFGSASCRFVYRSEFPTKHN
jgi:hypothetical protein